MNDPLAERYYNIIKEKVKRDNNLGIEIDSRYGNDPTSEEYFN